MAVAPTGAAHPASRSASTPRSALTVIRLVRCSSAATSFSSPARVSRASAPCPGAVGHGDSSSTSVTASDRPSLPSPAAARSEEHTSELQSRQYLVCRLLLEKKKKQQHTQTYSN